MPEAPEVPETPAAPAPEGTPGIDWEKRYNDLRPQFDRSTQEARAAQDQLNDADYQRQLMAEWGYEVEDPNAFEQPDPNAELQRQLAELQEWKNSTTQEQQQAAQLRTITQSVDEQFRATAPDLDEATREWITTRALNMDPRDDGMPDIAGAHQAFSDWELARQKQWAAGKRSAPRISPNGAAGTQAPNLDDKQDRIAWMAEQLQAANDAT